MWWLWIVIPLFIILSLLFLKVRLCIIYNGELSVGVKILFFNLPLFPKKQSKLKPSDYSIKKLEKRKKRLQKKQSKKQKKAKKSNSDEQAQNQTAGERIKNALDLIKIVLENVLSPFGKYLRLEIVKLHVKVAEKEPDKTAILYGVVSQLIAYIIEILENATNVDVKNRGSIRIYPDFVSGTPEADVNITLGLRVWHALSLILRFFMGYIKKQTSNTKQINVINSK